MYSSETVFSTVVPSHPEAVEDALLIWTSTAPYCDFPSKTILWRLLPALGHGKCLFHYENGEVVGLTTYAFLTEDEGRNRQYYGPDCFPRTSGQQVWFIDQIIPGGSRHVRQAARDLKKYFFDAYPEYPRVYAWRGPRMTSFPNRG